MKTKITRRQALRKGMGMAGAFVAGAGLAACRESHGSSSAKPIYPWPYALLDKDVVKFQAYKDYRVGHCSYATFHAIAGTLAGVFGEPYTSFPFEMWFYGHAGIVDWGTVCGTLNGAAAAMALFHRVEGHDPMIDSLFTWYENTALPQYLPARPVLNIDMPSTTAESPLCHVSVGKWIKASGFTASGPERVERCARLAADVAGKAVEILNEKHKNDFHFQGLDTQTRECLACHGKGKMNDDIKCQMHCTTCHEDH